MFLDLCHNKLFQKNSKMLLNLGSDRFLTPAEEHSYPSGQEESMRKIRFNWKNQGQWYKTLNPHSKLNLAYLFSEELMNCQFRTDQQLTNPDDNALSCREFQYFLIFSKTKEKKKIMYIFPICLASLLHSKYKQKASKLLICISDRK